MEKEKRFRQLMNRLLVPIRLADVACTRDGWDNYFSPMATFRAMDMIVDDQLYERIYRTTPEEDRDEVIGNLHVH